MLLAVDSKQMRMADSNFCDDDEYDFPEIGNVKVAKTTYEFYQKHAENVSVLHFFKCTSLHINAVLEGIFDTFDTFMKEIFATVSCHQ
jgi:hypothetical protein